MNVVAVFKYDISLMKPYTLVIRFPVLLEVTPRCESVLTNVKLRFFIGMYAPVNCQIV